MRMGSCRAVSLDPRTFVQVPEEPVKVVPIPLASSLSELKVLLASPEDREITRFVSRSVTKLLADGIGLVSYKLRIKESFIYRASLHIGVSRLWGLPELKQIERDYWAVHRIDASLTDKLGMFFSFGPSPSGPSRPRSFRFLKTDASQVGGMAKILKLDLNILYQISMLTGLLEAEQILPRDNNQMAAIIRRFDDNLKKHTAWVRDQRRLCERRAKTEAEVSKGKRITWVDIVNGAESISYEPEEGI